MSRNERGYFKKQVLAHARDANEVKYFKLFDAIEKQKVYDEQKLIEKFKNEKFVTQFPVAKNYLTFQILKSLVQFHSGKSVESELNLMLDFASILFSKGFFRECRNELAKAKELSSNFDKHDYTLTVLKKEKQLIASLKNKDMVSDLQKLLEEEIQVLNNLRIESELSVVYYNFLNEIHKSRFTRNKEDQKQLQKLKTTVLNSDDSLLTTFNSKNYYYGIETIYNYLTNNFEAANKFGKMHCNLWEENQDRFNDDNTDYLEIVYHYLSSCFQTSSYEVIENCLKKFHKKDHDTSDKKLQKYFIYYTLKLRFNATLGKFDEMKSLLQEIEEKSDEIMSDLYPSYKITICLGSSISYFILQDYSSALRWLNIYRNNFSKEFRKDAYSFSRIFNLMIHYKLGNDDLLEHAIKNSYREIKVHGDVFEYEKIILQFLKQISKNNSRKNVISKARELQKNLQELTTNPIELDAMRYFNFGRWLESEIQQVPYRELVLKELKVSS